MKRRRLIILSSAAFLLLECAAIVVGIWPILFYTEEPVRSERNIRMGFVPVPSRVLSESAWSPILSTLRRRTRLNLVAYHANTYQEVLTGVKYGSLDLAYLDPGLYRRLRGEGVSLTLLALDRMVDDSVENRSALVTNGDIGLIVESQGDRLTFVDKLSFSGYQVPHSYLEAKLDVPLDRWFSSVTFANTHAQAVSELIKGKTDVVATSMWDLVSCVRAEGHADDDLKVLWMSSALLPGNVVCAVSGALDVEKLSLIRSQFFFSFLNAEGEEVRAFLPVTREEYDREIEKSLRLSSEPVLPGEGSSIPVDGGAP